MKAMKYPGRDRVLSRDDARDYVWRRTLAPDAKHPCLRPVVIHAIGLPSFLDPQGTPLPVEMYARCRKCAECLAHRRRLWTARAVDEIKASSRTWFGTLTVRPAERLRLQWEAERAHLRPAGEAFSSLDHAEQYRYLADALGKELTRYLKRIRKVCGFRYFAVFEAHKDGFPHVHLLIHEQGDELRKRVLDEKWRIGFSRFKLADDDPGSAIYVAKYLSKDALTRVRASQSYGQGHRMALEAERLETATRTIERAGIRERERSDRTVEGTE